MQCEICHKAEAVTVCHRKGKDGSTRELYVCRACAESEQIHSRKKRPNKRDADCDAAILMGPDKEPPPFVKDLMDATLGFMKGLVETTKQAQRKCPKCGTTWEKIESENQVGCPHCWKAFADDICADFLRDQYDWHHRGEAPKGNADTESRAYLKRALKKAIEAEEFEKAEELKRKLDALGKGGHEKK